MRSSILMAAMLLTGCRIALWPLPVPKMPRPEGPRVCTIDAKTKAQKCEVRK